MGGRNKQAHRTKNNTRPSNSGRSAELLGNNIPQFSGKESGFILPTFSLPNNEDMELEVDANFQLVFKKMNKKDATTKLKALQEFSDLVKNSDAAAVKAILPFWPRLYNILATDSEHKVREATHLAHNEVVQKVKRNLAPYLKQLIAPWFTSQYDNYPPAATAATVSFNAAFPEKKSEEAIVFCSQEILTYIHDNLLIQTPQTVCNPKHNTPEDAAAKYERVIISSLLGYSLYLKKIPSDKIEKSEELNRKIVDSSKFWKYSKHNLSVVRAAWFKVLTGLFEKAPFLLYQEGSHVTTSTLANIDETDPVVLPLVWQNVLLTVTTIKEWWTKINIEKLMLPKLWKILMEGGQGNAAVIYPNLLPLLSSLTSVVDPPMFYNNFFQNLCSGLKQKSVIMSKSESSAVSTTLIECLRYVVMKNEHDINLCEKLIKTHLISTLEWCLSEVQSCYKTIFNQTASLTQYWSRNNTPENPNYFRFLNFFWENVNVLFQTTLVDLESFESEKIRNVSDRQIEFLQSMKHTAKIKKSLKVKFDSSEQISGCTEKTVPSTHNDQFYNKSLLSLAFRVCESYIELINKKKNRQLLENLVILIQEFDPKGFFLYIGDKMGSKEGGVMIVFQKLLKEWLESESLISKPLIDMIFTIYKYLGEGDKKIVLKTIDKITNEECLGWCIEEALSHNHNKDHLIQKWLKSDKVAIFLVEIVQMEICGKCSSTLSSLLRIAITENENEELLVSHEALSVILEKLQRPLSKPNDFLATIDTCASLASYISAIVYTEKLLLTFSDDLLINLFSLSCDETTIDPDYLSSDTFWEVRTAWQDAFAILSAHLESEELLKLIDKIVIVIRDKIRREFEEKSFEKIAEMLVNLCRALYKGGDPSKYNAAAKRIFENSFVQRCREDVSAICMIADYYEGNLTGCYDEKRFESDEKEKEIEEDDLLEFFTWCYLTAYVLTSNLEESERGNFEYYDDDDLEEEDDEDEINKSRIPIKFWSILDEKIDWICVTLHDYQLASCFHRHFRTIKYSSRIQNHKEKIRGLNSEFANNLPSDDLDSLKNSLRTKCFSDSWLWCHVIYDLHVNLLLEEPTTLYESLIDAATSEDKRAAVHLTQVFGRHLNYDSVTRTFDFTSRIIVLRCLAQHCTEIDVQMAEVLNKMEEFRSEDIARFNLESFKQDWISYQNILELSRLFSVLIEYQFESLSRKYIDIFVISLAEWLKRLDHFFNSKRALPMIITVVDLYKNILKKIEELKLKSSESSLTREWSDLFAEETQNDFIWLWLRLAGELKNNNNRGITSLPMIYCFASMTDLFDHTLIFKSRSSSCDVADDKTSKWSRILKVACVLLTDPAVPLQLAAHKSLICLIPGWVEIDSMAVDTNTPNKNGLIFEQFKDVCLNAQDIVDAMLLGLKVGEDSCRVEAFTDSFCYTFAYLLIWDVILTLCEKASTELKYQYADWLRQEEVLTSLFNNLFRLMPTEILDHPDSKNFHRTDWFSNRVSFDVRENCSGSEKMEHLVCWIYFMGVSQLPALVRQWWAGAETRVSQIVEKITSSYVSPLLCHQELTAVAQHEKKFKNMTIKVLASVREVIAVYTVDEAQMELVITLPTNYPLTGPKVQCNRQIGGTSHKQWLMQFKKCVLHQNGRIWDGLSLWNNNLDKKFDGVEECYICFSVLHPGTYQLPKLSCQTCKKKFHSACLYKWFSTSNKSSCPICRNLF